MNTLKAERIPRDGMTRPSVLPLAFQCLPLEGHQLDQTWRQ